VEAVEEVISAARIKNRIHTIGKKITEDYDGEELVVICVLNGALFFHADLCRAINPWHVKVVPEVIATTRDRESREVRIEMDLRESIEGRYVLLVEDLVLAGRTMQSLCSILGGRRPASLGICLLLENEEDTELVLPIKYVGFPIPKDLTAGELVGFGLGGNSAFRTLPFIGVVDDEDVPF